MYSFFYILIPLKITVLTWLEPALEYYPLLNSTLNKPHFLLSKNWPQKFPGCNSTAGSNHASTVNLIDYQTCYNLFNFSQSNYWLQCVSLKFKGIFCIVTMGKDIISLRIKQPSKNSQGTYTPPSYQVFIRSWPLLLCRIHFILITY